MAKEFYTIVDFGVAFDDLPAHAFKQLLEILGQAGLGIWKRVSYLLQFRRLNYGL